MKYMDNTAQTNNQIPAPQTIPTPQPTDSIPDQVLAQKLSDFNITPTTPHKKFGTGKIVATILGILVLVGGIGGGVYLTGQQQDIRERAQETCALNVQGVVVCNTRPEIPADGFEQCDPGTGVCNVYSCGSVDGNCLLGEYRLAGGSIDRCEDNPGTNWTCIGEGGDKVCQCCPPGTSLTYGGNTWATVTWGEDGPTGGCASIGAARTGAQRNMNGCGKNDDICTFEEQCTTLSCGGTTVENTASCQDIKTFKEDWTALATADLSKLKAGDKVNLCVRGETNSGTFNKAKFNINGVEQTETTTKKPNTQQFCQLYTIPADTTTFTVTAQVNHETLGWK
jgi:hypothetical protein